MKTPLGHDFSGIRTDEQGQDYVVHKPTGTVYLLRKPTEQIALVQKQTAKQQVLRPIYPKLARATFVPGSAPKPKESSDAKK